MGKRIQITKASTAGVAANSVNARLRALRGDRSLREFATVLGIHHNTIQNYEKGRVPDIDFLLHVWERTKCDRLWLFFGIEDPAASSDSSKFDLLVETFKATVKCFESAGADATTRQLSEVAQIAYSGLTTMKGYESFPPSAIQLIVQGTYVGLQKRAA